MSSILDALNKLEEEQDRARQAAQPVTIDPAQAAQELVSRDVLRDHVTLKVSPMVVFVGGVAAFFLVIAGVVGVTVMVLNNDTPDAIMSQSAEAGTVEEVVKIPTGSSRVPVQSVTATEAVSNRSGVSAADTSVKHAKIVPLKEKVVLPSALIPPLTVTPEAPIPEAAVSQEMAVRQREIVEPARKAVEEPPVIKTASKPVETAFIPPPPREMLAERPNPVGAEPVIEDRSIASYPVFTRSVQANFGLKKLRINMLRPRSEGVPYPSAVINMVTVFEGETILNSSARLFKVESHGIGVEISRTGEKYYLKF
ncbi:MAG: hypothetical protein COA73_18505 [Candidatus Hydrogenedentota bacterium]|nr:MAG: hypothetical protein COA73_18505 [Candidatus Hydrogenedentota bacterium]